MPGRQTEPETDALIPDSRVRGFGFAHVTENEIDRAEIIVQFVEIIQQKLPPWQECPDVSALSFITKHRLV
jgi:hypothetical protein